MSQKQETFAVWDVDGRLQYAENLGEWANSIKVVHAADGDHIAVLTRSRLLLWP